MAEISKIKVGETTYDIKDEVARNAAENKVDVQIDGISIVENGVANIPLANKLDKVETESSHTRAYAVNGKGEQVTIKSCRDSYAEQGTFPRYYYNNTGYGDRILGDEGVLITGTPQRPYHAANKKYVDDKEKFLHKIIIWFGGMSEYGIGIDFINKERYQMFYGYQELVTLMNYKDDMVGIFYDINTHNPIKVTRIYGEAYNEETGENWETTNPDEVYMGKIDYVDENGRTQTENFSSYDEIVL